MISSNRRDKYDIDGRHRENGFGRRRCNGRDGSVVVDTKEIGHPDARLCPGGQMDRPSSAGETCAPQQRQGSADCRERAWGWRTHYAVGIVLAIVPVAVEGTAWLHAPTWMPALITGVATVVFPWFVMQPAMGAGVAASRTPAPLKSRLFRRPQPTLWRTSPFIRRNDSTPSENRDITRY